MMLLDVVVIVGCLLTSIENFFTILIGRFIEGIAAGANNSIIPLYVNEITPLQISGKMVIYFIKHIENLKFNFFFF